MGFRCSLALRVEENARRSHAHNALLATHGLSPYDLTPEQLQARSDGAFIDPKDVKPRVRPQGRHGKVDVDERERSEIGWYAFIEHTT